MKAALSPAPAQAGMTPRKLLAIALAAGLAAGCVGATNPAPPPMLDQQLEQAAPNSFRG